MLNVYFSESAMCYIFILCIWYTNITVQCSRKLIDRNVNFQLLFNQHFLRTPKVGPGTLLEIAECISS